MLFAAAHSPPVHSAAENFHHLLRWPRPGSGGDDPRNGRTAPGDRESRRTAMAPRGRGRSVGGSARPRGRALRGIMYSSGGLPGGGAGRSAVIDVFHFFPSRNEHERVVALLHGHGRWNELRAVGGEAR